MNSKRILIIDDDKPILSVLSDFLSEEGYVVDTATNGKIGLELLESTSELPGIILLDLMMPVMDGFEFRRNQQRNEKISSIPVVIMTADDHIEIDDPRLAGIKDLLKKPFTLEELEYMVRNNS